MSRLCYVNGAMRAPDPSLSFKSLRLAWISRLSISEDTFWKSIPTYFFQKYGGLSFLLRCNYDSKCLEKSAIPPFYRQILLNFFAIRNLYKYNNGHDLILFNNKDILIDGKSFSLPKWKEKGVVLYSQDILDNDGKP